MLTSRALVFFCQFCSCTPYFRLSFSLSILLLLSCLPPLHSSCRVVCNWILTQGPVISADELPAISFPHRSSSVICAHVPLSLFQSSSAFFLLSVISCLVSCQLHGVDIVLVFFSFLFFFFPALQLPSALLVAVICEIYPQCTTWVYEHQPCCYLCPQKVMWTSIPTYTYSDYMLINSRGQMLSHSVRCKHRDKHLSQRAAFSCLVLFISFCLQPCCW